MYKSCENLSGNLAGNLDKYVEIFGLQTFYEFDQ